MSREIAYRVQYCRNGQDITSEPFQYDPDEVRAWEGAHGDMCILAMVRSPAGGWVIDTSDLLGGYVGDELFDSLGHALSVIGRKEDIRFRVAEEE